MAKTDDYESIHPLRRDEWRAWLAQNYAKSPGVWFVYYKKQSGKPRVTYDEAVEEALCFGWIDSLPRKLDEDRSSLLFTPRKPKSVWSKLNKERIEKLVAAGLMTESGAVKIEAAKKDGSWNALNDSDNLLIPEDLAAKFKEFPKAEANFTNFSNSVKKAILYWISSAKREETRTRRIEKTVRMAAENKRAQFDKE